MDAPNDPYTRTRRFAALLRERRSERNLTRHGLAKRARLGPSTVNQIERILTGGKLIGMPQPDTLRALAVGLATDYRGQVDTDEAKRLHNEFMVAMGYCDPPGPIVVEIPREVIAKLAELPNAQIQIGLTGRSWTEQDTANALLAADEAIRQQRRREQESA